MRGKSRLHRPDHRRDVGRHVDRQAHFIEHTQEGSELRDRRRTPTGRGMTPDSLYRRSQNAVLLFRDLNWIQSAASDPLRKAANLAEGVTNACEDFNVLLDEELR